MITICDFHQDFATYIPLFCNCLLSMSVGQFFILNRTFSLNFDAKFLYFLDRFSQCECELSFQIYKSHVVLYLVKKKFQI